MPHVDHSSPSWRKRSAVLGAVGAMLITAPGCGGSESTSTSTSRPTSSPTFQTMDTATAATYYLTAVCPANEVFDEVGALTADWAGQTTELTNSDVATLTGSAETLNTSVQLLNEPPAVWPTPVQVGVVQVAAEMGTVAASYQAMAQAPSRDTALGLAYTGGNTAGGEAQLVRERLGLPPDNAADNGCP